MYDYANGRSIAVNPQVSGMIYAGTAAAFYRSPFRGSGWEEKTRGMWMAKTTSVAVNGTKLFTGAERRFSPNSHNYSIVNRRLDEYSDWNVMHSTWAYRSQGVIDLSVRDIVNGSTNPDLVLAVGYRNFVTGQGPFVLRSTDNGVTWNMVFTSSGVNQYGCDVDFDPANENILYAAIDNGASGKIYKSTNAGASWFAINTQADRIFAVEVRPQSGSPSQTIYACGEGVRVIKSTNAGATWTPANGGLPSGITVYDLSVDPANPEVFYAGTSQGIYKTTNGGITWLLDPPACGSQMPLAGSGAKNSSSGGDDPQLNPRNLLVQQALLLRFTGRYSEAVSLLRSMAGNNSLSGNVRSWAVHQLFAVTQRLPGSNVASFLRSAAAQYPSLARDVRAILPRTYLYEGSSDSALSTFNANIQLYPNSAMERAALYGKFVHTMYTRRDTAASHTLHDQLLARYEGSLEATLVALQWNIQTGSPRLSISPPHLSAAGLPKSKVSQSNGLPTDFALGQNYPNPFNPSTTISYAVPADAHVRIKVYDVLGREALTLVDGPMQAGYHQVQFDGSGLASGVYLYRMESANYVAAKKFLLLK